MDRESSEEYFLNWNEHLDHLKTAFNTLLNSNELCDVTLYAEGYKIRAHKIILSACSEYFNQLFNECKEERPIVVLKGIQFEVLRSIISFIYNGQVSIAKESFNLFLEAAEFLKVVGLSTDVKMKEESIRGDTSPVRSEEESLDTEVGKSSKISFPKYITRNHGTKSDCKGKSLNKLQRHSKLNKSDSISPYLRSNFKEKYGKANQVLEDKNVESLDSFSSEINYFKDENLEISDDLGDNLKDDLMHSSFVTIDKNTGLYQCKICKQSYQKKDSLKKHFDIHSSNTTCTICNKVLSRKTHLERHLKTTHGLKYVMNNNF